MCLIHSYTPNKLPRIKNISLISSFPTSTLRLTKSFCHDMSQGITNFFAGGWWEHRFPSRDVTVPRPRLALEEIDSIKPLTWRATPVFCPCDQRGKAANLGVVLCFLLPNQHSPLRNYCRKVHLITSKLHLHFIFISHRASSSLFYSNFSIHHLFSPLQSSLLFLIYTAFSPQEFCSRRACAEWTLLMHPLDAGPLLDLFAPSFADLMPSDQSLFCSAATHAHYHWGTCWTQMHFYSPVWACQNYFICFLQL